MASENSEATILEDGVFFLEDADVGRRVHEFDEKGFPFQTEAGLDFCRESIVDDKRIRAPIESIFEYSRLGLLKAYGPSPGHIFAFLRNAASHKGSENTKETNKGKEKVRVLVVQLCSSNSRIVYQKRSHHYSLEAVQAKNGLFDISQQSIEAHEEIEGVGVYLKVGGLVIIDGRLGWTILEGLAISAGIAVEDELKYWNKMKFPNTTRLRQLIKEMEGNKIGMNVEFVNSGAKEDDGIKSARWPT